MNVNRALKWTGIGSVILIAFALIWIFWLWRFFAPGPLNPLVENPIYSISDCLVHTVVEFPEGVKGDKERLAIVSEVGEILIDAIHEERFPVASLDYQGPTDNHIYTLFTQKCDRKFDMMRTLARHYHTDHPNGARLVVREERVEPGYDTMEAGGPYWTDGETGGGTDK